MTTQPKDTQEETRPWESPEYDEDFSFPDVGQRYVRSKDFEGTGREVVYLGARKLKPTEFEGKTYRISHTNHPFFMKADGSIYLDKNGNKVEQKLYDPKFPDGYTVEFLFDSGAWNCSSKPAYEAVCAVHPKRGDILKIKRAGQKTETIWTVAKVGKQPEDISFPE